MSHIEQSIHELVNAALNEKRDREKKVDEPVISITTRTSAASFVYERMRNAVDYREEHLLRRNAIERMLRRLLTTAARDKIAESLIEELIHARYLPNDAIPQRTVKGLEHIITKYFTLLGPASIKDVTNKSSTAGWMLGIMATEIDEFLVTPHVMHAAINAMYEIMHKRVHIEEDIDDAELGKQIYIACSKALYKNDEDTLKYHLFLTYFPHWPQADDRLVQDVAEQIARIRKNITTDLNHPIRDRVLTLARKHVAYFLILRRIVDEDPMHAWQAMQNDEELKKLITSACSEHYRESRNKLKRSVGRSIIYLILTKFLIAIVLEIPVEYLVLNEFHIIPLLINLIFPPVLLATIAYSTKLPDDENTRLIIAGIQQMIQGDHSMIQMPKHKKQSFVMQVTFVVLYSLLFAISFGFLVSGLQFLNFTFVGIMIFLLFLSLVSLFAYRIRRSSQELIVTPPRRGIIRSLWSFFSIPVLHAGKLMSDKFSRINVFIFILDFVIEAPFKSFIKIVEDWMNYVHEKKEEI